MKAILARSAGFPWFGTIFSLLAVFALGGRAIAGLANGQFRVPFSGTVLTVTQQPVMFYSAACVLIVLAAICILGLYDNISTWRQSREQTPA